MARGYIQVSQYHPEAALGRQYVYLAGSTDLATVYDPISGDPLYNPVSIDSDGYVQAFEVDDSILFDIRVVSFNGTTLFTRSNLSVLGGTAGAPGAPGIPGVKGDTGDIGPAGADGAPGAPGADGADGIDGIDGVSLVSIRVDENSSTGKVLYNKSDDPSNWIEAGDIVPGGLGQVKVSSSDSLGYLEGKVTAGDDISITNSGTNLEINNTAPETFKTQASQYSTVKDFLNGVIEGTSGITVSVSADFNKIILSGAGIGGSGFTPRGAWDGVTTYVEGDGVWYYDSSVTPVINRYYVATATNTNVNPYTDGTDWTIMFSIDQLGDQLVKLDANDSVASFLLDKIVAGTGITFTRTVDAGGDYITIDGAPVWSIGVNGTDKSISDVSNTLNFVDGEVNEVVWDGNNIQVNHDTFAESGTVITHMATGLPKFDEYGHYKGQSDAIEISDVNGLGTALTAAGDGKVAVDNSDTKGYLADKLTAIGAVELYNVGSPTDKDVQIVGTGKVATDSGDTVGYLENKVIAGENVTINKVPHLTGESLEVSVTLPELDDDEPIIAEFGNYSSIYLASNNSGNAIFRVAGKYTEFPMNTKRIDNKVGGSFSTMNGVFSPEKAGYYVCNFTGYVQPSTSTSRNQNVYLSCHVETSYDGNTWVDFGGSESTKHVNIVFPSTGTYPEGYGKQLNFHMVIKLKDNQYSNAHEMARLVVQQHSFGAGYDNSLYIHYPLFAWYELKKPVGIQGPKGEQGDPGVVPSLDSIPDVDVSSATNGQVLTYDLATSTWIPTTVSGGGVSDGKVKVTASDPTAEYLYDKLTAGAGMTISTDDDTVTLSVNPPQDSLQTFQIAMADSAGGTFSGSFGHLTAVYVPYNTTIDRMACYVTQTGSGDLYLCVYDENFNSVGCSNAFTPDTYGVTVATMSTTFSLSKNTRYYFAVIGSANGCQLLKFGNSYASNEPFLAKVDYNVTTPPAVFSMGSSSSDRFWIIGYKS